MTAHLTATTIPSPKHRRYLIMSSFLVSISNNACESERSLQYVHAIGCFGSSSRRHETFKANKEGMSSSSYLLQVACAYVRVFAKYGSWRELESTFALPLPPNLSGTIHYTTNEYMPSFVCVLLCIKISAISSGVSFRNPKPSAFACESERRPRAHSKHISSASA